MAQKVNQDEVCIPITEGCLYLPKNKIGNVSTLIIYHRGIWVDGMFGKKPEGSSNVAQQAYKFYGLSGIVRKHNAALLVTSHSSIHVSTKRILEIEENLAATFDSDSTFNSFSSVVLAAHSGGQQGLFGTLSTFNNRKADQLILLDSFYGVKEWKKALIYKAVKDGSQLSGYFTDHNKNRMKELLGTVDGINHIERRRYHNSSVNDCFDSYLSGLGCL